jgi:hypothetical protein
MSQVVDARGDPSSPDPTHARHHRPRPRGPPRPHRKLAQDTLDSRIEKLQKRIDRSKTQMEDATRHIEGYLKESVYRKADASAPPAP